MQWDLGSTPPILSELPKSSGRGMYIRGSSSCSYHTRVEFLDTVLTSVVQLCLGRVACLDLPSLAIETALSRLLVTFPRLLRHQSRSS